MKVYQTNEIRNIALVGSGRSGKTILAESMLFEGGIINRKGSISDQNTTSDYREIELERKSSVYATQMYTEYRNHKINIIDTPGLDDFCGEVVSAMHVTDANILVLNAQNGVEVGTELAWRQAVRLNHPTIFAINQVEHEKSNFEETIREAVEAFGNRVIVMQFPINAGVGFNSVIDVLKMKQLTNNKEGKCEENEIPEEYKERALAYQSKLMEAAAENEEALMEKFFEVGMLDEDEMRRGLKAGIMERRLFPVMCISAKEHLGIRTLLDFIISDVPSPNERKELKLVSGKDIEYNASGVPQLFVYKTAVEPHLGEVSFFKVTNGSITEGIDLVNSKNESRERLSQIFVVAGKIRNKVDKLVAGDLGITIKLKETRTGDTLNGEKAASEKVEGMKFPEPKYRMAIKAKNQAEDEKLGSILKQISHEDLTLICENSVELKQTIVSGQGELHLNVIKWIIEHQHKIAVEYYAPKIPYRETITKPSKAMYRHKKQSGGAGQFGEVHMMIQPYVEDMKMPTEFSVRGTEEHKLSWGGKLIFNNCIVGGAIDTRFLPAILKGIMEKMEEGPLTGSYARDIVVSVYDGKMHPVDSNEISFKLAGRNAFKEAFRNAGPKIMEPIYDVEVYVPEEAMGSVMTDLQGRRAMIMGMETEGHYQRIKAKVPLAEMNRYSTSLSAITGGRATYGMKFSDYQQVPTDVQEILLKAYDSHEKEEE